MILLTRVCTSAPHHLRLGLGSPIILLPLLLPFRPSLGSGSGSKATKATGRAVEGNTISAMV